MGIHQWVHKPAGTSPIRTGDKPAAYTRATHQPFPFPPPCPGAVEKKAISEAHPPLPSAAPSTPTKKKAEKSPPGLLDMTPPKKSRSHLSENHLNGWENTKIPIWLQDVPIHLRRKLVWSHSSNTHIPDNAIILLFVGEKDGDSLDEILAQRHPDTKNRIFAIDLKRDKRFNDFLSPEPYNSLCTAASEGRLYMVGGGPMCRTWSVLRLLQLPSCNGMICRGIVFGTNPPPHPSLLLYPPPFVCFHLPPSPSDTQNLRDSIHP